MKIAIVGAGLTGLCTYLYLRKYLPADTTITIYESHHPRANPSTLDPDAITFAALSDSTQLVGGAVGLAPNGMRTLANLDPGIHDDAVRHGAVVRHSVFRAARGWKLAKVRWGDERDPEEWQVAVARHRLWAALLARVGQGVVRYCKVAGVEVKDEKVLLRFEDGVPDDEVDLVVGADGVKSAVRRVMFDDKYPAKYEGLLGVGGFIEGPIPESVERDKAMVFTFGGNGFFGYSASGDKEIMWWSTYEAPVPEKLKMDPEDIRAQLQSRHCMWKDPVIQDILDKANVESIYPTWTTPLLPNWGGNGLVILGDAAHGLQPTSGQGSSQAFEDAHTFSFLLRHYLKKTSKGEGTVRQACDRAAKACYAIRGQRVKGIFERSNKIANKKKVMSFVEEMTVYFFIWLLGALPTSVTKKMMGFGELYGWDAETEVKKFLAKPESS